MSETQEQNWTTIIKPKNKLLDLNFKEIWQYRDLFSLFIKRDIITQYKQTILGPLWFLIQPAITVIMYMVVFGGIAGIPTDGAPQPLFYLAGICMWQYFADCLNKTANTFLSNAGIFGKVYFPRLISPLSVTVSNLVRFGVQFFLFVAVYLYFIWDGLPVNVHLNWYALLFPLLVLMLAGLAFGFGVLISSMTTKYRDLQILFTFIVQLWMYGTPIVYPLSKVTEMGHGDLLTLICLNPVTPIIETFKHGFLNIGEFIGWGWLAYSFAFVIVLILFGMIVFNRVQKSFMDTV